jgi:hypothetical protein
MPPAMILQVASLKDEEDLAGYRSHPRFILGEAISWRNAV